jgi:hypothetical protein
MHWHIAVIMTLSSREEGLFNHLQYIIWLNAYLCKYFDQKIHALGVLTASHSPAQAA